MTEFQTKTAEPGADDLDVMFPRECKAVVAGRDIVCREYGFIDELRLRPITGPFIDGLAELINDTGQIDPEATMDLITKHWQALELLMAESAGVTPEWVRGLSREDGSKLFMCWWSACFDFFVGCARDGATKALVKAHAGQTSSASLSGTDTPTTKSDATPSDN